MSCPKSPAPKCCKEPKQECPPAVIECPNIPKTETFQCPSDDCAPPQKQYCEEKPKEDECVSVGKPKNDAPAAASTKATENGACVEDAPPAKADAKPEASGGAKCGNSENCCDPKPLVMDDGCK